jgi:hypothetical protein
VAVAGKSDELNALEEVRSRLEDVLQNDENWRALRQLSGDNVLKSAAHRARDTRLKMALSASPLYQAWRHIGEAIATLRQDIASEAGDGREAIAGRGAPGGSHLAAKGIASGESRSVAATLAERLKAARLRNADGNEETGKDRQSTSSSPEEVPGARDPGEEADPADPADLYPQGFAGLEPKEATVTFVRRSVETPIQPASKPVTSGMVEASNAGSGKSEPAATSPGAGADDEAEVTIVVPDHARERQKPRARAGTMRSPRTAPKK